MFALQTRGLLEHSGGDVDTCGDRALLGQPPRALTGTAADLEHLLPVDVAEEADIGFVNSSGHQMKSEAPRNVPCSARYSSAELSQ